MKSNLAQSGRWLILAACVLTILPPAHAAKSKPPQRVRSYAQLAALLKQHQPRYFSGYRTGLVAMAAASATGVSGGTPSFSSTTVQVAGVDEGDQVKNDGAYIYQINQARVLVIQAEPTESVGVTQTLDFSDGSFYPQELYLDPQFLIVVGTAFRDPPAAMASHRLVPIWYFSTSTVKVQIYDRTDPAHLTLAREIELDGDWVATRKIGSSVYLVARQYPDFYPLLAARATGASSAGHLVPSFRDTAVSPNARPLSLSSCYYFPGFDDPNYLIVAGVDVSDPNSRLQVNAYLGAGDLVYASTGNLYVAASRTADVFLVPRIALAAGPAVTGAPTAAQGAALSAAAIAIAPPTPAPQPASRESTDLYKFSLDQGRVAFVASGSVPGSVKNSYSMDENGDYFRVATTRHAWWSGTAQDSNNVYVLDATLKTVGQLEGLAPGEQIYAARFLGNRAFLVTFQQIDPLFAIDLSDPAHPTVVGQLTLPGYSQFLIPYDENHLIGIGKDVVVAQGQSGGDVPWWDGRAFYQGLKIALFDVTDLQHPALLDSVSIGDRGSDSPVLWDPHALLFDHAKNLLALPVSIAQVANPDPNAPWQWGDTVFQGAYVYDVSVEHGLVFRGQVTHHAAAVDFWEDWLATIERVLYIGPDLFTLSNAELKVNDLETLAEKTTLALPQPPADNSGVVIPFP